jgi:hypothetical protein
MFPARNEANEEQITPNYAAQERFNTMSNEGPITVNQVDVKSFAAALWNPQYQEGHCVG